MSFLETKQRHATQTRREFLATSAAAAAMFTLPHSLQGQQPAPAPTAITGTLSVNTSTTGFRLPLDFTGLSYESAQLANPAFFSAENKAAHYAVSRAQPQRCPSSRRRFVRVHHLLRRGPLWPAALRNVRSGHKQDHKERNRDLRRLRSAICAHSSTPPAGLACTV